jgi:hypothetical protein
MQRPTGVTILAVLYFLGAAFMGLAGLGFLVGGSAIAAAAAKSAGPGAALFAAGGAIIGGFFLAIALLDLALGVGFIKLQNWARVIAIVLTGIGLLFGLFGLMSVMTHMLVFQMVFQLLVVGLEIWIVAYLSKPDVKQAFGATGF